MSFRYECGHIEQNTEACEICALRAEVEPLKQNPEGYWRGQWAQEAQLRVAAESQVEALKKERDDFKWKYENESNRIGATRLAEINALRARSEAAESEVTRLKAELDNARECLERNDGIALCQLKEQDAELTRLKAELANKQLSVALNHEWAQEVDRLREREKVLVEVLVKELRERGDTAYLNGMAWSRQTECLGWEQKVKEGRFGKPEMDAHKRFNEYMGAHFALHEAARVVAALSAENNGK